ncbi:cholesterol 25-hydroxylase-like protein 1, member 2 [Plakobranchus ocellatus]|uniref:Cholesterol 25-hydroxylase-like protein 1, member 2 n=1 Tax=Plakobranchus ocellatus TaxID=259542 RepID=A0AAV4DL38_9GAST|nr:cholesterol 25-hydroxylase-like protein 1, member 2 [Plakobranchus ocellatus]
MPTIVDMSQNMTNSSSPESVKHSFGEDILQIEWRFLQPLWDICLCYDRWLESPVFPVILSVVTYMGLCLPYMFFDIICKDHVWYRKYKIQSEKEVTMGQMIDTLSLTFWNHILFIMPAAVAQMVWVPVEPLPNLAPPVFEFVWHQVVGLFVFDFQYFVYHVVHHKVRFLYRHIHSVHHRYHSPFVWVTQYLHPWELTAVGLLITTNMWFFKAHPLTVWSYMLLNIIISVDVHTGFDFPVFLQHLDPTGNFGGSPKHDMHHQRPLTNFGPYFNHLDKLYGSFCPPMSAGGRKSKALLDYERKARECKKNL